MKVGVLTSSRADFGIYFPLLEMLNNDNFFDLEIIAFGTHLDKNFGHTIDEILTLGFQVKHKIKTLTENDSPFLVAQSIAKTQESFALFWNENSFDLVIALGDRYEMFAAVSASTPFNIDIAHIHAGETTLGAIDNAYRHSISHMAKYLFVTNEIYEKRALELVSEEKKIFNSKEVFNVGALSIDNLVQRELYSKEEFLDVYGIDMNEKTILCTFHPETVSLGKNALYIDEILSAFEELHNKYQIVVTMPNSDTMGNMIRERFVNFKSKYNTIILIESFGMKGYLSCMRDCSLMLGNTSSGFVEASFFPKWVLNLGDRQNGRLLTNNILDIEISKENILKAVSHTENNNLSNTSENIYGRGDAAKKMIKHLKSI